MNNRHGTLNSLIEWAADERLSNRKRIAALQAYKAIKSDMTRPQLAEYARFNEAQRLGVIVDVIA